MLLDYNIDNKAVRIEDKTNITKLKTPFIAYFMEDFAVVYKVESDNVYFFLKGDGYVLTVKKFIVGWNGVVLLAKSSETSIEPD